MHHYYYSYVNNHNHGYPFFITFGKSTTGAGMISWLSSGIMSLARRQWGNLLYRKYFDCLWTRGFTKPFLFDRSFCFKFIFSYPRPLLLLPS